MGAVVVMTDSDKALVERLKKLSLVITEFHSEGVQELAIAADEAASTISRLTGERDEARQALKPFAATAAVLGDTRDSAVWAGQKPAPPITFGDLRNALRVLTPPSEGE